MTDFTNLSRKEWVDTLYKIVSPVLRNLSKGKLKETMPSFRGVVQDQYLEAFGRILCGIAPWLNNNNVEDQEEYHLQQQCLQWTIHSLRNIVDESSNDCLSFHQNMQSVVDTAYLCEGLLRMPDIWKEFDSELKNEIVKCVLETRRFKCPQNNWLLFQSVREAFLMENGVKPDDKMLSEGVKLFNSIFYHGDGLYGDGVDYTMDYYNSYVIHPMLLDTLKVCKKYNHKLKKYYASSLDRFKRYVEIQERTVSPEGFYPIYGRTMICRLGAFHALALSILDNSIPENLAIGQIKGCMDALLDNFVKCPLNFDNNGFLTIGLNGIQLSLAESYVSSGSPYHISTFFLPLGLSSCHPFWKEPSKSWTSLNAFNGIDIFPDHALHDVKLRTQVINSFLKCLYLIKKRFL